ncbi:hypothetical protein [Flavobacterium limi]|uniref:Uncharacterized protein n=1 Tax=Flavobacterium limi TaxID=2045105 RepID=A0ABQ1UWR7_9FLAO|nr:hypothetical protein [Flavobacterium limi]GGF28864.1 hypothetical protein GCM10011518_42700 [Flavobacterium limi]
MSQPHKPDEEEIMSYLLVFMEDDRISVWHLAIMTAILCLGYRQGQKGTIQVSRTRIMKQSHINTIPTYHKYFKELRDLGYIEYVPSYNPGYKSEVILNQKKVTQ